DGVADGRDRPPARIDLQPVELEHALGDGAGRAAQQRADARDQLGGAERLGHVVVGADLEAQELVALTGARGHHQDRNVALLSNAARDLEAVNAGEPQVENHERRLDPGEVRQGPPAVRRGVALEPRRLKVLLDQVCDARVVFDDQYSRIHGSSAASVEIGPVPVPGTALRGRPEYRPTILAYARDLAEMWHRHGFSLAGTPICPS